MSRISLRCAWNPRQTSPGEAVGVGVEVEFGDGEVAGFELGTREARGVALLEGLGLTELRTTVGDGLGERVGVITVEELGVGDAGFCEELEDALASGDGETLGKLLRETIGTRLGDAVGVVDATTDGSDEGLDDVLG
jgi:hypothetical protein